MQYLTSSSCYETKNTFTVDFSTFYDVLKRVETAFEIQFRFSLGTCNLQLDCCVRLIGNDKVLRTMEFICTKAIQINRTNKINTVYEEILSLSGCDFIKDLRSMNHFID